MPTKKDNKIDTASVEGKSKAQIAKERKKLRNEVTHKLRFQVLERDNFTCHYCGRSPKTHPGLDVAVDHVIPIDGGGKNEMENLVTACHSCNEGKKNKRLDAGLPTKVWKFNNQDILKTAETSTNSAFSDFLLEPTHEEERLFLYETNEKEGNAYCVKDCTKCIASDVHFYRECFKRLHAEISGGDSVALVKRPVQAIVAKGSSEDILHCDFCYISTRCAKYRVGAKCAFNFKPQDVDFKDTKKLYQLVAAIQSERVLQAVFFEKKDGGAVDKNVSSEIGLLLNTIDRIDRAGIPKVSMLIEGEGKEGASAVGKILGDIFDNAGKEDEEVKVDDVEDAEIIDEG